MSNKQRLSKLFTLLAALALCGSALAADNSVHVIPASALAQWWVAAPGHANDMQGMLPLLANGDPESGCLAIAFEIHSDGSVSNERVWHSVLSTPNASRFKQTVLQHVHQWRFVPAAANSARTPVYTYHIVTFTLVRLPTPMVAGMGNTPHASDKRRAEQQGKQDKAPCEMTNFPQQVEDFIAAQQAAKHS